MNEATEFTGWGVAVLFCVTVVWPFVQYRQATTDAEFLLRMRTHFSIGFAIAALSLVHAALAVSAPMPGATPYLGGIAIATVGLFLAFGQVALGLQLRRHRERYRSLLRVVHLTTMAVLAVTGILHLLLDGPMVRCLLHVAACPT